MNHQRDSQLDTSEPTQTSRRSFLELSGSAVLAATGGLLTQAGRAYPADSTKKIRMAVVGGGFGAGFWWHEHPNCVVTAVTDLYPERRARLKDRYGCDAVYDSLEVMLKEAKDVDAVAVFSGATDHARHVKACMENGWHVCSAVPACVSLEEAAMLQEVKEKTGLRYMMAESSWYRQECIFARNFYREEGFGELFYSEVEYYHGSKELGIDTSNKKSLIYHPDGSRSWRWGFPPMLYPTHSLGFLTGVTGERVSKVSCLGWASERDKKSPVLADNEYDNPFRSQASIMLTDRGHMCRCNIFWCVVAGGERAQWFGDKATLYMPIGGLHGAVQKIRGGKSGDWAVPEYWKSDMLPEKMRHVSGHGGSAVFISAEFVNSLLENREPEIDLYESLAITVPGIVGQESAFKDGQQLDVPQFDRPKS